MEYDNNHFIIASRAYSLHRAPGPGGVAAATTLIAVGRRKEKDWVGDLSGGAVRHGGRRRRDALLYSCRLVFRKGEAELG
jgi:hypothetical protein